MQTCTSPSASHAYVCASGVLFRPSTQPVLTVPRSYLLPTARSSPCVCREPLAQCASIATVLRSCLVSFLHGVGADPKFPQRVPKFPKRVPKFPQRVPAALINTAEPRPSVLFRRRMTARSTRACATVASRRIRSGAHPFHVIGTGLTPAAAALGLGSPLPHLHQAWAHPATSAQGLLLVAAPALRPTRLHSASGIIGRALVSVKSMEGVRRLTGAIVRSARRRVLACEVQSQPRRHRQSANWMPLPLPFFAFALPDASSPRPL